MLSDYDFDYPSELIAQEPPKNRADARMMVVDRKNATISHHRVHDLPRFLKPEDCLVVNNTKVLPARLVGTRKKTGGQWEGLFVGVDSKGLWKFIGKTRGKMVPGELVNLQTSEGLSGFDLEFVQKLSDHSWLGKPLTVEPKENALDRVGWVPIPPYIRDGRMRPEDKENYQTIYASEPGAVAAPTAGLHFTPELLETVQKIGTALATVTLHVGIGTFRPIMAENIADHTMHSEWCEITEETVSKISARKQIGGRIVAGGTTSVRVLESASQRDGQLEAFSGETALFIRPPYSFNNVDVLLTNFHFPKSTLLILVQTFGGGDLIRRAYQEAIQENYRLFSYGDAMLVL